MILFILSLILLIIIINYSSILFYKLIKGTPVAAFSIYNKQDSIIIVNTKTPKWSAKFKSFSLLNISNFIGTHFLKRHTTFDFDILNSLEIVFFEDGESQIESFHKSIFDFHSFKWKNHIFINIHHLMKYNDLQFAEIILHEYFHFWMNKYKSSFDDNHTSSLWRVQNIFNNNNNKGNH